MKDKTLIVIIGCVSAAFLGMASQILVNNFTDLSNYNFFGFGFSGLLYIVIPVLFSFLGLILSKILLPINSLKVSLAVSILFGFLISIGFLKNALAMFFGFENFHKTYLQFDIFQICSNLIIFPLIGFLIWNVKNHLENNYQNQ